MQLSSRFLTFKWTEASRSTGIMFIPVLDTRTRRNKTEKLPLRYALRADLSYVCEMRCAFVVRLCPETKPSQGRFEGWIEEVDTGKELRFHSNDELLKFMGERFEAVLAMEPDHGKTPCAGIKDADET